VVILNFGEGYMRSKRYARRVKNRLDFAMMFGGGCLHKIRLSRLYGISKKTQNWVVFKALSGAGINLTFRMNFEERDLLEWEELGRMPNPHSSE
jgi:hypothetical protein